MTPDTPTLILLAGLGSDSRIYAAQRDLPLTLRAMEWIEAESCDESLAHYGERIAGRIKDCRGCMIGGMSLGAMVALEAAKWLDVSGVLLIGGCRSYRQISPTFRAMLATAAATPTRWIHPALAVTPFALRLFERLDFGQRQLMERMLQEHSPAHIRWSCRAILEWEFEEPSAMPPVHAIHGENDEVIPVGNVVVEEVVRGGRHLINMDHPAEVNRFILERVMPPLKK